METLRQHACQLTWDPNTASANIQVSKKDEALVETRLKPKRMPHHPERFQVPSQIMSLEGLSGCHFFQVEWFGRWATIGMTYKDIRRKGSSEDCTIGLNKNSWGIFVCTPLGKCNALHDGVETEIPDRQPFRVGVYLDWAAGTLSFYKTSYDKGELIHTFHNTFTHPLFLLVSVSAGVKLLPDVPPPMCIHDHDPWGIFSRDTHCEGCNGQNADYPENTTGGSKLSFDWKKCKGFLCGCVSRPLWSARKKGRRDGRPPHMEGDK